MSRYARKPKPCLQCGTVMMIPPNRWERTTFCSRSCKWEYQREHRPPTFHGKHANSGSFKPGMMSGANSPKYVEPIQLVCEHCGKAFSLKPWVLRQRSNKGRFCSTACRGEHRRLHESGPNNPMWVGGPKTYRGRGWRDARHAVVTEQQGHCARCGVFVGMSLAVHHIRPFREFATAGEANVRGNLVGLCQSCHMQMEHQDASPANSLS